MVLSVANAVLGVPVKIPDFHDVLVECQDAHERLANRGETRSVRLDSKR